MKKKVIFAVATGLFALATVFNMNVLQSNSAGDVSLDAITVMAQAQKPESDPTKIVNRQDRYDCSYKYVLGGVTIKEWSCTNCAWDCMPETVPSNSTLKSNCTGDFSCTEAEEAGTF